MTAIEQDDFAVTKSASLQSSKALVKRTVNTKSESYYVETTIFVQNMLYPGNSHVELSLPLFSLPCKLLLK